jgi:uncharacterized protein YdcH (DUF465 family)
VSIPQEDSRQKLLEVDGEYERLAREHSEYETRLERLSKSPYLSAEDLLQEIELKKRKLRIKDRMEQIALVRGGRAREGR